VALLSIELNDIGIIAAKDETVLLESPGYALLDHNRFLVGVEAYQRAHLFPRRINCLFWERLGHEALPERVPHAHSYADLVCAHLSHIWEQVQSEIDAVVFAVPGSYRKEQLGLLLGISRELAMPVRGLVDAGVVACEQPRIGHRLIHLDIQLHRSLITVIESKRRLERTHVDIVDNAGTIAVRQLWTKAIADRFIRDTRFDPFHVAATEQQLYDQLPAWLEELSLRPKTSAELINGESKHRITLDREQLIRVTSSLFKRLTDRIEACRGPHDSVTVQLSHRLAHFPGLHEALNKLPDCDVIALAPGAAALGAIRHAHNICSPGQSLAFITTLPSQESAPDVTKAKTQRHERPRRPPPTHAVYEGLAHPLGETPLWVTAGAAPADQHGLVICASKESIAGTHCSIAVVGSDVVVANHGTPELLLNEQKIAHRATLQIGDKLRIGDIPHELQLIALIQDHETQDA
jgi:hypothetical protein